MLPQPSGSTSALPNPIPEILLEIELMRLPGWRHERGVLHRAFTFPSMKAALTFAAELEESLGHVRSPSPWMVVANQVLVHLSTKLVVRHVSDADVAFAHRIERLHDQHDAFNPSGQEVDGKLSVSRSHG